MSFLLYFMFVIDAALYETFAVRLLHNVSR